jgi:hypothetical protein
MLGRQFPKVEAMLHDAADDITAFAAFLIGHWLGGSQPFLGCRSVAGW